MAKVEPLSSMAVATTRTISVDQGLLSNEELLVRNTGGKINRSLEHLIAMENNVNRISTRDKIQAGYNKLTKQVQWFIEKAELKISVSCFVLYLVYYNSQCAGAHSHPPPHHKYTIRIYSV